MSKEKSVKDTKCVAVITARGGSKRIPRKNIRDFLGFPIIKYSIEAAIGSGLFTEVIVSTDDAEIAKISTKFGASVPFMRSPETSDDFAGTDAVLKEVLLKLKRNYEFLCCLYPTAPFVSKERLKEAFGLLVKERADAVIPVVAFSFPIQRAMKIEKGLLEFIWPEEASNRSQDLPGTYHDAGQFYFLRIESFKKQKEIWMEKTCPLLLPESEVQDIDNEEDWKMAEMKYKILKSTDTLTRNLE